MKAQRLLLAGVVILLSFGLVSIVMAAAGPHQFKHTGAPQVFSVCDGPGGPEAECELIPSITLTKTVGLDPAVCAPEDVIYILAGTDVFYCYEVQNTGTVTFTLHNLVDSELGTLIIDFPFTLTPNSSVFLTTSTTINQSTVNTATWRAYNPGPTDLVNSTDSASVHVVQPAPFGTCTGFEAGRLPPHFYPEMITGGAANSRVSVTSAFPHTGNYALDIDTDCDGCGGSTRQAGVMVVDLGGVSEAILDFWVHEHGDENNPEDGVFISDDNGVTWSLILSLNNFPNNYTNVTLDLDEAAANQGMSLVDGFRIKFQSIDNFSIPTDGYSFDDICVQPPTPEIQLNKTVGTDPGVCAASDTLAVPPGTDVHYCYEVTNTGFVPLTRHDLDDSELGSILSDFNFTLTPGSSVFITQTSHITQNVVNSATWIASNPGPTDVVSATASATVTVLAADLQLTKTAEPETVSRGQPLTYTLTVGNHGSISAATALVTDTLPAATGFLNATTTQGSCSETGGIVSCSLGNLDPGSTATIQIVALAPDIAGLITNFAEVTSDTLDANPVNNTASVVTRITGGRDLFAGDHEDLFAVASQQVGAQANPPGQTKIRILQQLGTQSEKLRAEPRKPTGSALLEKV